LIIFPNVTREIAETSTNRKGSLMYLEHMPQNFMA
jgi:hypothetical protein